MKKKGSKMVGGGMGCKGNAPKASMDLKQNKGLPKVRRHLGVGGSREMNYPLPGK